MITTLPATIIAAAPMPGGAITHILAADGSDQIIATTDGAPFYPRKPMMSEAYAARMVLVWNAHSPMVAALLDARETFLVIDSAGGGTTLAAIEEALAIAGVDLSRFAPPPETGAPPASDHPQHAEGAAR